MLILSITSEYNNFSYIDDCINKNISFLNNEEKLSRKNLDKFPKYIIENKEKFKKWIY